MITDIKLVYHLTSGLEHEVISAKHSYRKLIVGQEHIKLFSAQSKAEAIYKTGLIKDNRSTIQYLLEVPVNKKYLDLFQMSFIPLPDRQSIQQYTIERAYIYTLNEQINGTISVACVFPALRSRCQVCRTSIGKANINSTFPFCSGSCRMIGKTAKLNNIKPDTIISVH